jgi:hypothetical protein
MAAETPDDGKDLECATLPAAFGRTERGIVAPSWSASHGLADDREIILRSADRGHSEVGVNGCGWAYSGITAQD